MSQTKKLTGSGFAGLQAISIIGDNDYGATATGTNAGTAYPVGYVNTIFTTVAASTGAILPAGAATSDRLCIVNRGANALTVYPNTGGTADGGASVSVAAGTFKYFQMVSNDGLTWFSK